MKEEKQMVQIDVEYVRQEIEVLMQTPQVRKLIYLQQVLAQLNKQEEVVPADETKED